MEQYEIGAFIPLAYVKQIVYIMLHDDEATDNTRFFQTVSR